MRERERAIERERLCGKGGANHCTSLFFSNFVCLLELTTNGTNHTDVCADRRQVNPSFGTKQRGLSRGTELKVYGEGGEYQCKGGAPVGAGGAKEAETFWTW